MSDITADSEDEQLDSKYCIPDWFLRHKVRTPEDLDAQQTELDVCDHHKQKNISSGGHGEGTDQSPSDADASERGYKISTAAYSELRDIIASAFVRNAKGDLALDEACVYVTTSLTKTMVFLSAVITHLAKDFRATLLELGMEDLEDLGSFFVLQDDRKTVNHEESRLPAEDLSSFSSPTRLAEHYFTVDKYRATKESRERTQRALSAVLESPRSKIALTDLASKHCDSPTRQGADLPSYKSGPVILHFHDLEQTTTEGDRQKIMARVRDAVQERRMAGEYFVLVYTAVEEDAYRYRGSRDEEMLQWMSLRKVVLEPLAGSQSLIDTNFAITARTSNIRQLKRFLRSRVPYAFDEEILHPLQTGRKGDSVTTSNTWDSPFGRRTAFVEPQHRSLAEPGADSSWSLRMYE